MLGTERDAIKLSIMLAIYGRAAKNRPDSEDGFSKVALYAFHDALERTALAFQQVLDGKRTPEEAYERLVGYTVGLRNELRELGEVDE